MIVVDSSVWIDYFNGADTRETTLLHGIARHGAGCHRRSRSRGGSAGLRRDSDFHRGRTALETLIFEPMVGRAIALASARNYRRIALAAGVTVRKTIDVLIATFCIEKGHALLHADRDFEPMKRHLGLRTL